MNDPETHLLITRPEPHGARFLSDLQARAGRAIPAILSPILRIEPRPLPDDLPPGCEFVLTSGFAVEALTGAGDWTGTRAWCVGDRTAARAAGLGMDAISAGGSADDLVARILESRPSAPLVHLCGTHRLGRVADRLRAAGLDARECVVYDQMAAPLSAEALVRLANPRPLIVPIFSPRSARLLAEQTTNAKAPLIPVAISTAVATAWGADSPRVSDEPNAPSMVVKVMEALSEFSGC